MNNEARRQLIRSLNCEEDIILVQAPGAIFAEDLVAYAANLDGTQEREIVDWDRTPLKKIAVKEHPLLVTANVNPGTIANKLEDAQEQLSSCGFLITVQTYEELRTAAKGLDQIGWGGGNVIFANRAAETQMREVAEAEEAASETLGKLQAFTTESPPFINWSLTSSRPVLTYEGLFTDHSPYSGFRVKLSEFHQERWTLEIREPMQGHNMPESFVIPLNPEWDEATERNLEDLLREIREVLPRTKTQRRKEGLLDVAGDLTSLPPRGIQKGLNNYRFELN